MDSLFFQMALRMCLIVTIAFLLTRLKLFRRLLFQKPNIQESVILTTIFGLIGIFGTYSAVEIEGALANSRVIGAVVAGLLGGPWMGAGAGLISGLHRLTLGGFTAPACALSTLIEGLVAGLFRRVLKERKIGWVTGLIIGVVTETLQMFIILLISRPFDDAYRLVKIVSGPMIIWNSIGISIFMLIVRNALEEEERIGAMQIHKALSIADTTLSHLRKGFNYNTAHATAEVIMKQTSVAAVAITDNTSILAHVGSGSDHHLAGQSVLTAATIWVLENGKSKIAETRREIGCSHSNCPLKSAVLVPLFCREQVIGALKLYHNKEKAISKIELEFAQGLAHLISTQLEIASLEKQSKLLKQAELDTLQAQVNPHFLFNALNTISSFSRSDGEKARKLMRHLADFFRKSILKGKKVVTVEEELGRIDSYLALEQARFGDRLQVIKVIDQETLQYHLPALLLQPLVENCIKHGILPKEDGGRVHIIIAQKSEEIVICVKDNGIGMTPETLAKILKNQNRKDFGFGLFNVSERLKAIYGEENHLQIDSIPGKGTSFTLILPVLSPLADEGMA